MLHYFQSIRRFGTADGYNTESSERLHIDYAKLGYRASNRKEYIKQMAQWLARQEAVHGFHIYLQWRVPSASDESDSQDNIEDSSENVCDNDIVSTLIPAAPAVENNEHNLLTA